jgi:MFS family permease
MIQINHMKKIIFAGVLGNTLEWYDFALYSYTAPILARHFFPSHSLSSSMLHTFAVFSLGFLARPLGGAVFGHIGDKFGRKYALILSMLVMTFATTLIGLLPTYNTIGISAPILLSFFLLLQGFAVSGEFTGSAAYINEHSSSGLRGLIGGTIFASCFVGKLMACIIVVICTTYFSPKIISAWAWRIPFLLASFFGIVILYLRLKTLETPIFVHVYNKNSTSQQPLLFAFKNHYQSILLTVFMTSNMAIASYLLVAYMPSFVITKLNYSLKEASLITSVSLLFLIPLLPIMGKLSDIFGRKIIMSLGSVGFILFSYPIFGLINIGTFYSIMAGDIAIAILLAPVAAPILAMLTEIYKTNIRYSASSIGYNIGLTIFGGTTPFITMLIVDKFHNNLSASYYLIFGSFVTLLALIFLPESYKNSLTMAD